MKLSVATNWDDELINKIALENIKSKNKVVEVFGSVKSDFIGSSRPSENLPFVSEKDMKKHIELCSKNNIQFNYVLNAFSYHNKEFTSDFRKKIIQFVSKLIDLGVNIVTITNPIIIETIRKKFPDLYICASTVCKIDTINRINWYSELGVNRIILETDINRDFKLLKKSAGSSKIELEVLANLQCIFQCPNNTYDYVCDGFRSQNPNKNVFYNYPKIKCCNKKLTTPVEFIKSPWIRPEDLGYYSDLNINFLKIAGREAPTNWLINTIKAYMDGSYEGNLFDLTGNQVISSIGTLPIKNKEPLKPLKIFLDNKKMNGFLNYFVKGNCNSNCEECTYCQKWVNNLDINNQHKVEYIKRSNLLLEKIRRNEI